MGLYCVSFLHSCTTTVLTRLSKRTTSRRCLEVRHFCVVDASRQFTSSYFVPGTSPARGWVRRGTLGYQPKPGGDAVRWGAGPSLERDAVRWGTGPRLGGDAVRWGTGRSLGEDAVRWGTGPRLG